ncbi:MAG TPA: class I SAM-dependent methyltransferase [Puia sp.]|nr:class I SAM-dependent methyltransferase [Puia sp.]
MAKEKMRYTPLRLARNYLRYYFTADNGKGHGIHSPFVFDLVTKVLNDRGSYAEYGPIETLRQRLRGDATVLQVEDMGAGSARGEEAARGIRDKRPAHSGDANTRSATVISRSVREIVRGSAKPPRFGQLLFRIARHYHPSTVVELGTSLGLSTAYLAAGASGARIYTIEGAPAVAAAAGDNLRSLGLAAQVIAGNFETRLGPLLERIAPVDLAFIDGNHLFEPTLRYFEAFLRHASPAATFIFDDIHWSPGMERAWASIKNDPRVLLTVDLFFIGLVFIREEFKVKQDFTIRF